MKKRSKTEVEIRNILSETLLYALRSTTEVKTLNLILKYCNEMSPGSTDAIYTEGLPENNAESDRVDLNFRQLSKDVHVKRLFVFGPGNSIMLKNIYVKHRGFICRKTKVYVKLMSSLRARSARIDDELENQVEVGVMLFNTGLFFECHEFLEELWLKEKGREKAFLKGLIHACVAFYHLEHQNIKGAVNYLKRSSAKLKEFLPTFLGIDVGRFLLVIDKALKVLEQSRQKYSIDEVPTIKLID